MSKEFDNIIVEMKEAIDMENGIEPCKGVYWRATVSSYISSHKSIETRKSLRLLKKMSCTGCPKCDWIWEFMNEDVYCQSDGFDYCGELRNRRIYTYQVNTSRDFESGYDEIDSFEFVLVKEPVCPICNKGFLFERIENNDGMAMHYSVCDHCGSEQTSKEQTNKNARIAREFKK